MFVLFPPVKIDAKIRCVCLELAQLILRWKQFCHFCLVKDLSQWLPNQDSSLPAQPARAEWNFLGNTRLAKKEKGGGGPLQQC